MKKTIATCLLLILILSCVFSFVACSDPVDPIVGKYMEPNRTDIDAYLIVRSNGTATRYVYYLGTETLKRQFEYSWSYDDNTNVYTFDGANAESYGKEYYILENSNMKQADYSGDKYSYEHISDSEWPDYIPKN